MNEILSRMLYFNKIEQLFFLIFIGGMIKKSKFIKNCL